MAHKHNLNKQNASPSIHRHKIFKSLHQGHLSRLIHNAMVGPIFISVCSSVFYFNASVESGLLYRYDLTNSTNIYNYLVDWNPNCNTTKTDIQAENRNYTAIQSLNWAAFLITRRRRGDGYTGGANLRLRLPSKYLVKLKTSKVKTCLTTKFDLKFILYPSCPFASPLRATKAWGLTWFTSPYDH